MANVTIAWQATPKLNTVLTTKYRSKRYHGYENLLDRNFPSYRTLCAADDNGGYNTPF